MMELFLLEEIITDFIKTSPENSLSMDTGEPAWEEVILGYSAGDDPIYESYLAPILSSHWKSEMSDKYFLTSRWSERHAAYASGLGTFGLCDGLITKKGKAQRMGSVIARVKLETTPRPYTNHHAYCLFFTTGKCMVCAKRCPVDAITEEGHDKKNAWSMLPEHAASMSKKNGVSTDMDAGCVKPKYLVRTAYPKEH